MFTAASTRSTGGFLRGLEEFEAVVFFGDLVDEFFGVDALNDFDDGSGKCFSLGVVNLQHLPCVVLHGGKVLICVTMDFAPSGERRDNC